MGRIRFALTNLIFWPILIATIFFIENIALSSAEFPKLQDFTFYFLAGFIFVLLLIYYLLEHIKNKVKCDWVLLIGLLIFFACGMFAIWYNPEVITGVNDLNETPVNYEITIPFKTKLFHSIRFGVLLIVLYTFLFTQSRKTLRHKFLLWFAYCFIIYTIVTIGYSLVTEFDVYKGILTGKNTGDNSVKSFYMNPNTYGGGLLSGIIACAAINLRKSRWWTYPLILLFLSALVFTSCFTSFALALIFVIIYMLIEIIRTYRKHPVLNTIWLIFYIAIPITFVVFLAISQNDEKFFFTPFANYFDRLISNNDFGSFSGRVNIWKSSLLELKNDPLHLIFGRGYGMAELMIGPINSNPTLRSCHSGIVQILFNHGIIGLSLYVLLIGYFFYCCIRLIIKKHIKFGLYSMFFIVFILIRGAIESNILMNLTVGDFTDTFIIFFPPMLLYKQTRHPKLEKEVKTINAWQNSIEPKYMIRVITSIITGLIVVLAMSFFAPITYQNSAFKNLVLFLLGIAGVSLIFVPYLISLWYRRSTDRRFIIRLTIYTVLVFITAAGVSILLDYYFDFTMLYVFIGYVGALLILTLIYMPICHGSFKEWWKNLVVGIFVTPHLSSVIVFIIGAISITLFNSMNVLDIFNLVVVLIALYALYFIFWLFVPFKETKTIVKQFNDNKLFKIRRAVYKEKF